VLQTKLLTCTGTSFWLVSRVLFFFFFYFFFFFFFFFFSPHLSGPAEIPEADITYNENEVLGKGKGQLFNWVTMFVVGRKKKKEEKKKEKEKKRKKGCGCDCRQSDKEVIWGSLVAWDNSAS
jgi:hypothetical protein